MEKRNINIPLLIGIILFSLLLGFISGSSKTSVVGQLLSILFPALISVLVAILTINNNIKITEKLLMTYIGYFLIIFTISFSFGSYGGYYLRSSNVVYEIPNNHYKKLTKELCDILIRFQGKKFNTKKELMDNIQMDIGKEKMNKYRQIIEEIIKQIESPPFFMNNQNSYNKPNYEDVK